LFPGGRRTPKGQASEHSFLPLDIQVSE
jgi:hypothetical protein